MTISKWLLNILLLAILSAFLTFFVMTVFVRPVADDYCIIADAVNYGVIGSVEQNYENWSGRYTTYYILSAMSVPGIISFQLLPLVTMLLFIFGCFFAGVQLVRLLKIPVSNRFVGLLSLFATFIVLSLLSPQALYWAAGLVSYLLPLVVFIYAIGGFSILLQNPLSWRTLFPVSILTGFIFLGFAGFSETFVIFTGACIGLLLIVLWFSSHARQRQVGIVLLLCAGIALSIGAFIVIVAPGNAVRQQQLATSSIISQRTLLGAILSTLEIIYALYLGQGFILLMLFFTFTATAALLHLCHPPDTLRQLPAPENIFRVALIAGAITLCLSFISVLPIIYATGIANARSLVPVRFSQVILMIIWGYLFSVKWQRNSSHPQRYHNWFIYRLVIHAGVILTFLVPLLIQPLRNISQFPYMQQYASAWDIRHEVILDAAASNQTEITVAPLPYNMEDFMALEQPQDRADYNWINDCTTLYYGLSVYYANGDSEGAADNDASLPATD